MWYICWQRFIVIFWHVLYKLSKDGSRLYRVFMSFDRVDYLLRMSEMSLVLD